jgi:hypothetical protein
VDVRTAFDPNSWDGDFEELLGMEAQFFADQGLAQETFDSKYEAFLAGFFLGNPSTEPGGRPASVAVPPAVSEADLERILALLDEEYETETVGETLMLLAREGLIEWNGEWRSRRPVWVATPKGDLVVRELARRGIALPHANDDIVADTDSRGG